MIVCVELSTMSDCIVLDTVVIYGEVVCYSVGFVFIVVWSELLMTSVISCPLWSSV